MKFSLDRMNLAKAIFTAFAVVTLYFLPNLAPDADAYEVTDSDRQFLTEAFSGVWTFADSGNTVRLRADGQSLTILIDESTFLDGIEIIDVDRVNRAVTFVNVNGHFVTFSRFATYIRVASEGTFSRAEHTRRLTDADHKILDIWLNPPINGCGNFGQHCLD